MAFQFNNYNNIDNFKIFIFPSRRWKHIDFTT